jgi:hypothetical protein
VPDAPLTEFPDFAVASGEEASDPTVLHEGAVVRVDELAASGHLDRQDADLADVAGLGVRLWRYGMPWRQTEVEPGVYDWALWDQALAGCDRHGLTPVVDLCHFGLPDHLGGFCDAGWVDAFVRYVDAFLDRYPEPRFFTPVNEPMITARCSGLWGVWNDRRASPGDYGLALAHVTLANLEAIARVRADRDGWWIGAEGFEAYAAVTAEDEYEAVVAQDRALAHLTWDLHLGVEPRPEAAGALAAVPDGTLDRIRTLAVDDHHVVVGHDMYPICVSLRGRMDDLPVLTVRDRAEAYEREARAWYERYRRPFWVSETSNLGLPVDQGGEWLAELVAALDRMRADGLPARGVCWYSRGDQYDWDTMLITPVGQVTEVGLFDADRTPRPVAAEYARLAAERA